VKYSLHVAIRNSLLSTAICAVMGAPAFAGTLQESQGRDQLAEVMRLYGIDESAAIERLAKEVDAADLYRKLEEDEVPGYAGSWFDGESLKLVAATNDPESLPLLTKAGATPKQVEHSLADLQRAKASIQDLSRLAYPPLASKSLYIDIPRNRVVQTVAPGAAARARSLVATSPLTARLVTVTEDDETPVLSGDVRGADGTRNYSFFLTNPEYHWPCSIAASIVEGYLTAGHCGATGNEMRTPGNDLLGVVQESTYFSSNYRFDRGWVDTASGWTPTPTINGYSDGTLTVAAKWAGKNEAPVGATVCRYGQTSGGPHCGTVYAKDLDVDFGPSGYPDVLLGLTQLNGSCTEAGDSGGTHVFTGGQVQGVNIGGSPTGCPGGGSNYALFLPVTGTLSYFGKTMLTAHGASIPSLTDHLCPDMGDSGQGTYRCRFLDYNSQGATSILWTKTGGGTSVKTWISGTCVANQQVTVTLAVTNPYGTKNESSTFSCPMGPLP